MKEFLFAFLIVAIVVNLIVIVDIQSGRAKTAFYRGKTIGELAAQTIAQSFLRKNYGERSAQDYLNYLSVLKSGKNP